MDQKEIRQTDQEIVRRRLKERRLFLGMTYQALSAKTGISKSSLQRYETGAIKNLPYDKVFTLSEALDVTPEYFINLSNDFTNASEFIQRVGRVNRYDYLASHEEFEKRALEKITPKLIAEGYKVQSCPHGSVGDIIAIKKSEVWHLDFLYLRDVNKYPPGMGMQSQQLLLRFGRLAVYEKPITKYSIVLEHRMIAEQLIHRFKPMHLNIHISIIVLTSNGFKELNFL